MTDSGSKFSRTNPVVWLAAGALLALVVTAGVAAIMLPDLFRGVMPADTAVPIGRKVETGTETPIPTFTASPTLTPSDTPTPSATPLPSPTPSPVPTETPSLTPSVTPTPPPVAYALRDTRLYLGPSRGYPEQGWLPRGERAFILSQLQGADWLYLETDRAIRGWAEADSIALENDLSTVPVVTPAPFSIPPVPPTTTSTPEPLIGLLLLDEVWPVDIIACVSHFEFDLWIRAHGGTGRYTYLINDQVVAESVADDGTTERIVSPGGAWVGVVSVISGDLRVDRPMYFAPAEWCPSE